MKHPELDRLSQKPIADIAHYLRTYLLPLQDEFNKQNTPGMAGSTDVGLLDYLLVRLDSTYIDALRHMNPEHIERVKRYLNCFLDILSNPA